jgi:4-alpha-glucanotransferase
MIPCGEDLGVSIECVPKTMEAHKILGLRVVRWCREWSKPGQPYVPFAAYTPLSVTTTSVHDSSTIREWWETEKESVKAFILQNGDAFGIETGAKDGPLFTASKEEIEPKATAIALSDFTPEIAESILKASSTSASQWFIPPLQDFLYMSKNLWLEKASDERINIPGTVTAFNWTYRLPCTVEELCANNDLINKIKRI